MRSLNKLLQEGQMSEELVKILRNGRTSIVKVEQLNAYFKEHPKEKKEYERQYATISKKLKNEGRIEGCFPKGPYSTRFIYLFQASCVASSNPIMSPRKYLDEISGKAMREALPPSAKAGFSDRGYRAKRMTDEHQH